jgi:hypothetical protein
MYVCIYIYIYVYIYIYTHTHIYIHISFDLNNTCIICMRMRYGVPSRYRVCCYACIFCFESLFVHAPSCEEKTHTQCIHPCTHSYVSLLVPLITRQPSCMPDATFTCTCTFPRTEAALISMVCAGVEPTVQKEGAVRHRWGGCRLRRLLLPLPLQVSPEAPEPRTLSLKTPLCVHSS